MAAAGTFGERLAAINARIQAACARSGRDRSEITLVAVSKRQSAEKIRRAHDAGHRVMGENQVQETEGKSAELPVDIDWHLIGPLQSNKVKRAVGLFSTIHALDRPKILDRVEKEAGRQRRRIDGFLEVNLGDEPSKHGFAADGFVESVAPLVARLEHVRLIGLMAIPPFDSDPEASRPWFRQLRSLRDALADHPLMAGADDFGGLSMGMSGDFEVAIEEGATHVRVGTSLFGPRQDSSSA